MSDASPYPEIPDHVWHNIGLAHELDAEYSNRPKQFQRTRIQSSLARKHFSCKAESDEFWQEYAEAIAEIESRLPNAPHDPTDEEKTNEILGLVPVGNSIVDSAGWRGTVLHGGGNQ